MSTSVGEEDDDDGSNPVSPGTKRYDDFMLAEYASIAQAHFNTNAAIATFFKNYLAIVGLPLPLAGIVFTYLMRDGAPKVPLGDFAPLVLLISIVIAIVGMCVMIYVVNLRLDALLYARSVNGVRNYFYSESVIPLGKEPLFRVLPRSTRWPRYFEYSYFLPVIAVFAIVDTCYACAGIVAYFNHLSVDLTSAQPVQSFTLAGIFFITHFVVYARLARIYESSHVRVMRIGTDIDGVLNRHREHFCSLLHSNCGKSIDPNAIVKIPVRECGGLGVTKADEHAVFNDPAYWVDMPVADGAAEALAQLKDEFDCEIIVFTHRPWPRPESVPKDKLIAFEQSWQRVARGWKTPGRAINSLTRAWLTRNRIPCDNLVVELDKSQSAEGDGMTQNRFSVSREKEIRVFVEDDLFKARKLADVCEIVLLIDHPYNACDPAELPRNVVRVPSWREAHTFLRQHI